MANFEIFQGSIDDLDIIESLWVKLGQHHLELSTNFKDLYLNKNWVNRKLELITKSTNILFEYAVADDNQNIIGYCISSIQKEDNKVGEIDSLFIDEKYRKLGIGRIFMERSLGWMNANNVVTQKLSVGVGNEHVLDFYKQFDFYPKQIILQRVDQKL